MTEDPFSIDLEPQALAEMGHQLAAGAGKLRLEESPALPNDAPGAYPSLPGLSVSRLSLPVETYSAFVADAFAAPFVSLTVKQRFPWQALADEAPELMRDGAREFSIVLRVQQFADEYGLDGLPVSSIRRFPESATQVLDVFNPIVHREISRATGLELPSGGQFESDGDLAEWLGKAAGKGGPFRMLRSREPYERALALEFRFTLAGLTTKWSGGATYIDYTVASRTSGLQLLVTPASVHSPTPFGGNYTSPVTGRLLSGYYYYFDGSGPAGVYHSDPHPHQCSPAKTSTVTSF